MSSEITIVEAPLRHVLYVHRRVDREDIGRQLGEILPAVFGYAQKAGASVVGPPFVRYVEMTADSWTIEGGFPVADATAGDGDIAAGALGGQRVATTVHTGAYDLLPEAYRSLEAWMQAEGVRPAGPPWEEYLTDPAETPVDQWQTAVYWPVRPAAG